jgi:hypothetical protein
MAMPTETGIADKVLSALLNVLTAGLQTNVATSDFSRASIVQVGPRQVGPEGVNVLIHENDPDGDAKFRHSLIPWKISRKTEQGRLDELSGTSLIGGGSQQKMYFCVEIEVFGNFISGANLTKPQVRAIAAVVEGRAKSAVRTAGHFIGTGSVLRSSFGEYIVQGPIIESGSNDQEEGEALIVRRKFFFWYHAVEDYDIS